GARSLRPPARLRNQERSTKMKTFKSNRPLKIIRRAARKNGWPWDQSGYDRGEDWIWFGFQHEGTRVNVLYNAFNGRFLVRAPGGEILTDGSCHMDGTAWYAALCDFLYEPAAQEAA